MNNDTFKPVFDHSITEYRCGVRAGDQVRLRYDLAIRNSGGHPTGQVHPAAELRTVLHGNADELGVVWLRRADGEIHTWNDGKEFLAAFEVVPAQAVNRSMRTAGSTTELSDYGKERGKPLPSYHHAVAQAKLVGALGPSKEYSILSELDLELPTGLHLTPDISVYPKIQPDWNHDILRMKVMPLLVVEILTLGQTAQEAIDEIALYFASGVKSAWLVQPGMQSITIYEPGEDLRPHVFTTGEARDPVTGLTARLEEIFA